jgi:D-alanyl-D-alanine carboxypeptidase (penicillin-binding protein 5/6)
VKLRLGLVAAVLLVLGAAPAAGAAPPKPLAEAYLVQNGTTGETLLAHDAAQRVPIASITKLMTVLLAVERARLDDVVTVPPIAAAVGESSLGLRAGERLTVRDLVRGALVQSANDAAYALAYHVGGGSVSRFVALMNARARTLGLRDTHFARPDGLDAPGHVSSARDVTKLARVAMRKSFVRETVDDSSDTIAGGRTLHTWNDLLASFPGVFGVKTGHTSGAGWSQVAAARGPGYTIYATILGSPSRAQRNSDLTQLLAWGLSRYRVVRAIDRGVYATAQTQYGKGRLRLVTRSRATVRVRVDRALTQRVVAPRVVALPVHAGDPLGRVVVYGGNRIVAQRPLVAAQTIERPGPLGRAGWYAGRAASHAWGWIS